MDFAITIIELALMLGLFILAKVSEKYPNNRWRLLYAAPTFFMIFLAVFDGFDVHHIGMYIAAALQLLALFINKAKKKQGLAICSGVLILITTVIISIVPSYHKSPYYSEFEKNFKIMKEHYVLTKEKGIDWDALYKKYQRGFKKVDEEQDFVGNYKLWQQFTGEFYDGHVGYMMNSDNLAIMALCLSYGNDYGLSLARLSSGEYVAINVEGYDNSYSIADKKEDIVGLYKMKDYYKPENADNDRLTLKKAGIRNGTVITKWNGKPIDEYFKEVNYYMNQYPVRENEEFYLPMYVAGIGNNMDYGITYVPDYGVCDKNGIEIMSNTSVDITYIDEGGGEKQITAPNLGAYAPRMFDTFEKLDKGVNITNLEWQEINEDTYMIRLSEMAYDQDTYQGVDYSEMTDKLRGEVLALKESGVKNLIFDLRSNGGGSPYFVEGIAKLFAPVGEHLTYYNAVINEDTATYERNAAGKYEMGVPSYYEGEDLWHDGKIVLLVNAMTVSAGDDIVYMMGDYPNVEVIGFTRSNSSCQAVTYISGQTGRLSFSAVPNLLPNGEIAIDTYTDHVGRTPFDYEIPFSPEAINSIFDKGEDYLLGFATDYVNK